MTFDTDLLFVRLISEEKTKLKKIYFHKVISVKPSYEEQIESNQHLLFLRFSVN